MILPELTEVAEFDVNRNLLHKTEALYFTKKIKLSTLERPHDKF